MPNAPSSSAPVSDINDAARHGSAMTASPIHSRRVALVTSAISGGLNLALSRQAAGEGRNESRPLCYENICRRTAR